MVSTTITILQQLLGILTRSNLFCREESSLKYSMLMKMTDGHVSCVLSQNIKYSFYKYFVWLCIICDITFSLR